MELFSLSPYTAYGAAVTAVNVMNNTELKSKQSELVNFTTADESQFCSILRYVYANHGHSRMGRTCSKGIRINMS